MSHELTFILNRKCMNCGSLIADQVHAKRKFCPRVVLSNGMISNCKDKYNSKIAKPINEPFKYMAKWQKYYYHRIKMMVEKEGTNVTLEIINRYGINLHRPFEFKKSKESKFTFLYHRFAIENIDSKTYKITEHALF